MVHAYASSLLGRVDGGPSNRIYTMAISIPPNNNPALQHYTEDSRLYVNDRYSNDDDDDSDDYYDDDGAIAC